MKRSEFRAFKVEKRLKPSSSCLLSIILFAMVFLPKLLFAAEGSKEPINIVSDSMEAETKTNKVVFRGNVVARQKDVTITSNELIATYSDGGKELKEVLATGNVRITQQDKIAVAEKALFLNVERKIILTGNPKVWQGKDVISGDEIVYYLDVDRTEVKGKVRATIQPRKEETFANDTGKGAN